MGSSQITLEPNGDITSDASANIASTSGAATTLDAGTSVAVQSGTTTTLTSAAATSIVAGAAMGLKAASLLDIEALSLSARFNGSSWSMGSSGMGFIAPFVDILAQHAITMTAPLITAVAAQQAKIKAPDITLEGITHIVGDIDI